MIYAVRLLLASSRHITACHILNYAIRLDTLFWIVYFDVKAFYIVLRQLDR